VTESPVEINFSLMKVRPGTLQCAALVRATVPISSISITKAVALTWLNLAQSLLSVAGEQRVIAPEFAADGDYISIL
jgi:hypothetical protein